MTKEDADMDGQAVIFIPFSSLAIGYTKKKVFDGYLKNLLSKKCEDILAHPSMKTTYRKKMSSKE